MSLPSIDSLYAMIDNFFAANSGTPGCAVPGCGSPARTLGLCNGHYMRKWRYGNAQEPERRAPSGSGSTNDSGYRLVRNGGKARREHVVVAERALGRPLPSGAVVHHANGDRADNRPENLVICPDRAYHSLIHLRMAASAAGHPPDWRKCTMCKQWDAPDALVLRYDRGSYHPACHAAKQRERIRNLRGAK